MEKLTLFNKTKNELVTNNLNVAEGFYARSKGLLGKSSMEDNEALLIRDCNSIHTFFMKFAIDVVFINKAEKVVSIKHNVKPWRLLLPRLTARHTIEFSPGFLSKANIDIGDEFNVGS